MPHPRMSAFALTREERALARVSKDETTRAFMVRDGAPDSASALLGERLLTMRINMEDQVNEQGHRRANGAQPRLRRLGTKFRRQTLRRNSGARFLLHQPRQFVCRSCRIPETDRGAGDDQESRR